MDNLNNSLDIKIESGKSTLNTIIRKSKINYFETIEKGEDSYLKLLFNSINNFNTELFVKIDLADKKSPFSRLVQKLRFIADNNKVKYATIKELINNLINGKTQFFLKATLEEDETNPDYNKYVVAPWHVEFSKKSLEWVPKKTYKHKEFIEVNPINDKKSDEDLHNIKL